MAASPASDAALRVSSLLREGKELAEIFLERSLAEKCRRLKAVRPHSPLGVTVEPGQDFLSALDNALYRRMEQLNKHRVAGGQPPKPPYDEKFRTAQINVHVKRDLVLALGEAATLALRLSDPYGSYDTLHVSVGEDPAEQRARYAKRDAHRLAASEAEGMARTRPEAWIIHQCDRLINLLRQKAFLPREGNPKFYPLNRERHQAALEIVKQFGGYITLWEKQHGIVRATAPAPAASKTPQAPTHGLEAPKGTSPSRSRYQLALPGVADSKLIAVASPETAPQKKKNAGQKSKPPQFGEKPHSKPAGQAKESRRNPRQTRLGFE
jgi:hypothetical protein